MRLIVQRFLGVCLWAQCNLKTLESRVHVTAVWESAWCGNTACVLQQLHLRWQSGAAVAPRYSYRFLEQLSPHETVVTARSLALCWVAAGLCVGGGGVRGGGKCTTCVQGRGLKSVCVHCGGSMPQPSALEGACMPGGVRHRTSSTPVQAHVHTKCSAFKTRLVTHVRA